jgi:hypothetical protein
LAMKPQPRSVAPLLLALSLIGGCTSPAPHSADANFYELTARFLSREGRLYMEITARGMKSSFADQNRLASSWTEDIRQERRSII